MSRLLNILCVDDEHAILEMLACFLRPKYNVSLAMNGLTGIKFATQSKPDLIILDWMMPDISGIEVLKKIRLLPNTSHIPVILLTAKSTEEDKIIGFEAGADDYLVKPFSLRELEARIGSVLRRTQPKKAMKLVLEDLCLNLTTKRFFIKNTAIDLTAKEFDLMALLMKNPQRIYSREQLLEMLWTPDKHTSTRAVDVCISRLRKRLKDHNYAHFLHSVRGMGYRLSADE